ESVGRADLHGVEEGRKLGLAALVEERIGVRGVRVHAEEAVVRGRDGGGQHLPLHAADGGAGEVVDEQLVGESAQVDAQAGCQSNRGADAGNVGQPADDRILLRAQLALVVTCHRLPLLSLSWQASQVCRSRRWSWPQPEGSTPTLSQREPVARRTANVSSNGALSRPWSAPFAP